MTTAAPRLEIRGLDMAHGARVIQRNLSFDGAARRHLRDHGGQRLRQAHAAEAMAAAHSRPVTALARDIAGALRQAAGAGSRAASR
jgi:hypothetical protein